MIKVQHSCTGMGQEKIQQEFWGSAERQVGAGRKQMVSEMFALPPIREAELSTFQHANKQIADETVDL